MKTIILFISIVFMFSNLTRAQDEPFTEQIKSTIQKEAFTVNALLQSGFRYSLQDDNFQGGRTFEAANARLSIKGILDNKFYYRLHFNFVREPNLLDAYIGYKINDAFLLTAGAMKPKQSLDFIPDPGSTDFIDRAIITGLLVQSREIGLSAEGEVGGFYYFTGIFNGNKHLRSNNNNKFYGISRLQYSFSDIVPGKLQIAVQGSYGDSQGTLSGSNGPMLRGERTIYGGDLRWETSKMILAAEYMEGLLETVDFPDTKEKISGYYTTAGYKAFEKTHFLARWQSWTLIEADEVNSQFTFGINQTFTSLASFQFGFDSFFPETGDNKHGFSMLLQVKF
jgi:hypothetical protein